MIDSLPVASKRDCLSDFIFDLTNAAENRVNEKVESGTEAGDLFYTCYIQSLFQTLFRLMLNNLSRARTQTDVIGG